MLSAFVIAQLVFDVAVVAFAVVYLLTRQSPPPPAPIQPPEWYGHFLKVAQDLMVATEPVLDRLESGAAPVAAPMRRCRRWRPWPTRRPCLRVTRTTRRASCCARVSRSTKSRIGRACSPRSCGCSPRWWRPNPSDGAAE